MLLIRKVWGQFSGNFIVGKNGGSKASGTAWIFECMEEMLVFVWLWSQSRETQWTMCFWTKQRCNNCTYFLSKSHSFFFSSKQSLMSWICSSFKSKVAFGYPCIRMTGKRQLKFSENFIFWKLFIVYLCASHSPEMERKKECFWEFKILLFQRSYVLLYL